MKKALIFLMCLALVSDTVLAQKKKIVKKKVTAKGSLTKKQTASAAYSIRVAATADSIRVADSIYKVQQAMVAQKIQDSIAIAAQNENTISESGTTTNTSSVAGQIISTGIGILNGILGNGSANTNTTTTASGSGSVETGGGISSLANSDIVSGLKEALINGAQNSSNKLSLMDGFFGNAVLKILMPPEAKKVEETLRSVGLSKQVDQAVLTMNRAAEDAAKSAAPIFINAIKGISINDALGILKGTDTAATGYLRSKTNASLTEAFRPVIEQSLQKVDATKYWNLLFSSYNKLPFTTKINPDLAGYVTEKATAGIFTQLGQEEAEIRKNPLARTTDILRKVFGSKQ